MLAKPAACQGCPCPGEGFSQPEGRGTLGVLVVGEALGEHERRDGLPFRLQAPAGSVLERALNRVVWEGAPVGRERVRLCNVIACQPKGNWLDGAPWEQGAIEHCRPNFERVMREMQPRCFLALGGVALRALTGLAGNRLGIQMLRGFVLESKYGIPVVGSYHPSYLRRGSRGRQEETGAKVESGAGKGGMHLLPVLYLDILKAIEVAQHGWHKPAAPKYQTTPGLDEAWSFYARVRDNAALLVTADIETVESTGIDEDQLDIAGTIITQIQFSTAPGTAIVLPWEGEYKNVARSILATGNPKTGHNWWKFDAPRLRAAGYEVNGVVHDSLQMWKRYHPDLPAGLQFVASLCGFPFPWKHLAASDSAFYGGCDVDAVQQIMAVLPEWMKRKGCWRSYERHVLELDPILVRMSERGLPVNDHKRIEFGQKIDAMAEELNRRIQALVPDEVKPLHSPGGTGYKKDPKDAVEGGTTSHAGRLATWAKREFEVEGQDPAKVTRWVKVLPFNSNSSDQIAAYIRFHGHPMPKERRTERDTTSKLELKKLAKCTGDEFYGRVFEIRELTKLKGTYVDGFVPGPDGRIHSQFGHETGTGQLTSRRPNIQNCFSGDTEILTKKGWIPFEVLPDGVEVAQYDAATGEISFVLPEQVIRREADELLHIYKPQQIDLLVTPEHECVLVNPRTGGKMKFRAAAYPAHRQQLHAGQYIGGSVRWRRPQIVLLAALLADGHVRADRYGYDFIFRKSRQIERLLGALEGEGIAYKIYPHGEQTRVCVADRDIPAWRREKKHLGAWLLEMEKFAFAGMAEEISLWGGCGARRNNYSSNDKGNADWVQILQALTGKRARLRQHGHRNWQVDIAAHPYSLTANRKIDRVPGKTWVYCVTVPAGNVVVRRAGRVAITGNCPKIGHGGGSSEQFKGLASEFRSMIEARPGHQLVELDFKSAHALTLGFEAQDPDYMRLARIDMHSFLAAAGLLKLEDPQKLLCLPNSELKARLKWYRKNWRDKTGRPFDDIRNIQAKPAILGYGFAMGPGTLFNNNPESFANMAEARRVIQTLDRLFPRQPLFRKRIREVAAGRTFLVSRHGYIRWFFDVGYWDQAKSAWVPGDDAEACIAFLPANDAFGHIKDAMLRLEAQGWNERARLINQLHDALMFHIPDALMDEAIPAIKAEMESKSEVLIDPVVAPDGLWIETSVSVGRDWSAMEEIDVNTGWAKKAA